MPLFFLESLVIQSEQKTESLKKNLVFFSVFQIFTTTHSIQALNKQALEMQYV